MAHGKSLERVESETLNACVGASRLGIPYPKDAMGHRSALSRSITREFWRRVRARNPRVVVSRWSLLAAVGVALLACAAIWNGAPEAPAYVVCAVALGAMACVKERRS